MEFDWNDGNKTKCTKHGVTLNEIETLLRSNPLVSRDHKHSEAEKRFIAVGPNRSGRPLFVVFCWRDGKVRPISARYMHKREAENYET